MNDSPPILIEEGDLARAWARIFLPLVATGEVCWRVPVTVSITGFRGGVPTEDKRVRQELDLALKASGKFSVRTCVMTIFPFDFWRQEGEPGIHALTEAYLTRYLPRLKARGAKHNSRGMYFERMLAYQGIRQKNSNVVSGGKNQLLHVIEYWRNASHRRCRPRRSELQVAIFDPTRDQNGDLYSIFPCLQQISVGYDDDGLVLNAYYPSQYIFDRAYGNYLGLSHLGGFLAREIGVEFSRLNCTIVNPQLPAKIGTGNLENLRAAAIAALIPSTGRSLNADNLLI